MVPFQSNVLDAAVVIVVDTGGRKTRPPAELVGCGGEGVTPNKIFTLIKSGLNRLINKIIYFQ